IRGDDKSASSASAENSPVDSSFRSTMTSDNEHIKRGIESYHKKYYRDAAGEFNEVLESAASDKDKAIALTYLGMISVDTGDYEKAAGYFKRALSYDSSSIEIYKRLALALRHQKKYDEAISYAKQSIDKKPDDIDAKILLGNIYFEMSRYTDAVEQYRKALDISPENPTVLYNLASALVKIGDEFAAVEYLKRAASIDKFGEIAYRASSSLGIIYTEKGDLELAEKYLKQSVSIRPNNPVNRYNLGLVYMKSGKDEDALKEFAIAEEYSSEEMKMLENLGDVYGRLGRYDKSVNLYEKILKNNSRNVRALARIGEIYYKNGELDKAFDAYKKITMVEPASENARSAYLNMGNILDDAQRFDEAAEAYQKAISLNAKDENAFYNLGIVYQHSNKPELAISAWKESSRLDPTNPTPRLAVANYYYETGFLDLAEKEYQDILQEWPNIQEAHFKMGSLYYKQKQNTYAYKAFERAAKIDVNSELARKSYINMALINSDLNPDERGIDDSINLVQKALLIKPGDAEALLSFGILLAKKGQSDRAVDTFYQVVKNTADSLLIAQAYDNIGKTYYRNKDYKKAIQAFARAVEEDPSNEEIRMNRKTASQAYEQEIAAGR
ncbi:MAG: tetratricopeptide repeat protein, partial [Leptospirales bacterium]|nr:tetratricopeptide repeat protein [Leptospirales bacterium]